MKINTLFTLISLLCFQWVSAQKYKQMMADPSYNFYEVCKEADAYFATHFNGKGSGYIQYLRWRNANESKFYPSGNRSNANYRIAAQSAEPFMAEVKGKRSNGGWVDLGPYSANNITHGYNPGIGRVETFYVNPNNADVMYMGSRSGGFWRSVNGGQTWVNTTDQLVASGVNQIAVSPIDPNYVIINLRNGQNGTSHGLYISTDGGLNWQESNFNPDTLGLGGLGDNFKVFKLAINPLHPDSIYIGTSNGLYIANLALTQWNRTLAGTELTDIEFHPVDPDYMYAYDNYFWSSNENKILISNNGGSSFSTSATISGNNGAKGFVGTTVAAPDRIYFASDNGVWKTDDTGQAFIFLSNPGGSCDGFAVSDVDTSNMIYGYLDQYASWNGGYGFTLVAPWANSNPGTDYTHADLRTAECVNGVFYIGTDGYFCSSADNGNNWSRLNDGTGIREFYASGVAQGDYRVFMAGSQDNGTSILDHTGWIEWNGGDGMEAIVQPLNPLWMIGSWQYGSRNYTRDGGLTRTSCDNPSRNSDSADWQAPLFYDPNNPMKVYHFGTEIGISEDFGVTWTYGPNHGLGQRPTRAAIAYNNSNIMAASKNGLLRVTTDGWLTNSFITPGLPNTFITDIAFAPTNDSIMAVTFNTYQNNGKKVYISYDLGANWQNITLNLGDMPVQSVAFDHLDDTHIYVGTELGVYVKSLNGFTWEKMGGNLPNVPVRDLDIHFGSNTLKATTWGRGLWEINLKNKEDFPKIYTTSITNPPTELFPKAGYDQYVTAHVSSTIGLSRTYVVWSADTNTFDQEIEMELLSDSTYVSKQPFPYYPKGTKMYFKVIAEDTDGNRSETYKFVYTIKEGLSLDVSSVASQDASLYPNPNAGKFYLSFGQALAKAQIQVYNASGQQVYQNVASGNGITMHLNQPKGIYFLKLKTDEGTQVINFTVQ